MEEDTFLDRVELLFVMNEADVNSVRKQYISKQDTICVLKNECVCQ